MRDAAPNEAPADPLRIGVLASQGDFAAHSKMLEDLGAEVSEVRLPTDFEGLEGLVIPGGESTTISKAIDRDGLAPAIHGHLESGGAILGICAGMIVCDRDHLGLFDAKVRRNAFGRQLQSFEADLEVEGLGPEPIRAVFIRAPWIDKCGNGVEVLARWEGHPVVAREGHVLTAAFHPELTGDSRLHALFMAIAGSARKERSA